MAVSVLTPGVPDWCERLEHGELLYLERAPFPLPECADLEFLRGCQLYRGLHKNISLNPRSGQLTGLYRASPAEENRLRGLLSGFGQAAADWLALTFPGYARCWVRDRISYRPEEEATRRVRLNARNDLLHTDAFPTRPTHGARILRLYVNIHPTDPRVWATADTFPALLAKYGPAVGLPGSAEAGWSWQLREKVLALFQPARPRRSPYDEFMLRLHHFLKGCEDFQENSSKRLWHFAPGSCWLAFTDGLSHADLRGRYALEQSLIVPLEGLALPDVAPVAFWQRACQAPDLRWSA